MRPSSQLPLQQNDPGQPSEYMDRHHHNHCQAWSVAISGNFSGEFLFSHNTTLLTGQESMDLEEDKPLRMYSTPLRNARQ